MATKKKTPKEKIVESESKKIPEKPKSDPNKGDYTPEVLAWRKKYEPELYKLKFEHIVEKLGIKLPKI